MPPLLRTLIYPVLLPGGAVLLAAWVLLSRGPLPPPVAGLGLPALTAAGALLGWRFHRTRLVLGLALVAAAALALARAAPAAAGAVHAAAAVLLPLNLALVTLLPERGLLTLRGILQVALLIGQAAAVAWWHHRDPAGAAAWLQGTPWDLPLPALPLHQAGLAALAAAAAVLGLRCARRPTALDAGFLWALGACAAALWQTDPALRDGYFTAAAAILLAGLVEAFHFLAFRDELTGLPARRALNEALARAAGTYTLAMVDVDHFKRVNDRHGHDVGDQVLKMMAARLGAVTGGGKAYRYGGEEFTLLFPRRSLDEALPHLEQVRERVAAEPFRLRRFPRPSRKPARPRQRPVKSLKVTVSIGAAERGPDHPTAEAVLKAADKALYRAKRGGRNRVKS